MKWPIFFVEIDVFETKKKNGFEKTLVNKILHKKPLLS